MNFSQFEIIINHSYDTILWIVHIDQIKYKIDINISNLLVISFLRSKKKIAVSELYNRL